MWQSKVHPLTWRLLALFFAPVLINRKRRSMLGAHWACTTFPVCFIQDMHRGKKGGNLNVWGSGWIVVPPSYPYLSSFSKQLGGWGGSGGTAWEFCGWNGHCLGFGWACVFHILSPNPLVSQLGEFLWYLFLFNRDLYGSGSYNFLLSLFFPPRFFILPVQTALLVLSEGKSPLFSLGYFHWFGYDFRNLRTLLNKSNHFVSHEISKGSVSYFVKEQ